MNKSKSYEEKIETILRKRLKNNCNYNVEINGVKSWLCCECMCEELDIDTFSKLVKKVDEIADNIIRSEQ